jgi:hypothetical protein
MSVTNQDNKVTYTGNGSLAIYPIPFYFSVNSDIKVYIDDELQVFSDDYSLSGANDPDGGELTFVTPPIADSDVVILRDVPLTQPNTFSEGSPFQALTLESMFDRLTHIAQQVNEKIARAIKFPLASNVNAQMEGEVIPRGLICFNSAGDGLEVGPSVDTYVSSAISAASTATTQATVAAASAASAATSATNAAASASGASTSASTATTQATNASNSATAAATSATSAATSATNAATSASTATTQATNAATSAANAAISEGFANSSATSAGISAVNCSTAANNAATSASDAAASATIAANAASSFNQSFIATENVTNGGTVTTSSNNIQHRKVQGNGGAVTLSSTPFGSGTATDGIMVRLFGQSDTNTVGLVYSDTNHGVLLNGDCDLKKGNVLTLIFDLSALRWYEISRNF